jgi:PST family polysaccharide transporter
LARQDEERPVKNVASKLAKGSLWISASRSLANALQFLSTIVLARILVPEDFGLVALATTMLAILTALTNISMTSALVHLKDPTEDHLHTAWTLGAIRALVLAALFSVAAHPAARFYEEPRLVEVMYVLAISVVLTGLPNPRRVMLQKKLIFWQDFVLDVSQRLIGVVVSIVIAVVYETYWALVIGTVAGQLANVAISYTVLPFLPRPSFRHARDLWSFSIWLTLGSAINTINWRFDHLLIGAYLGRADLGYYTVGDKLAIMPTREATLPLTQTVFPGFAHVAGEPERLRNAYQRAQALVTAVALPFGIGMAVIADPLVRLAMGDKWAPAIPVIQALAAVFAIQTIGLVQPLAMAKGATKLLFKRDLQMFAVRLPFIIAGMYFGGLLGIVYARVFTGSIATLVNMTLVKSLTGLSVWAQVRVNLRALASVCIMAAGVTALRQFLPPSEDQTVLSMQILALCAAGAALYVLASLTLWLLMKRPSGPEAEIFKLAKGLRERVSTTRAAG